jgi:hypothetical protein
VLVFYEKFNPDETIKKVSLGKRAKVAGPVKQIKTGLTG